MKMTAAPIAVKESLRQALRGGRSYMRVALACQAARLLNSL
jgi:hypothetical protein